MLRISEEQKTLCRNFKEAFSALDSEDIRLGRLGTPEAHEQRTALRDQFVSRTPEASQLTDNQKSLVAAFKEVRTAFRAEQARLEDVIHAQDADSPKSYAPAFQAGYLAHLKSSLNAA